MRRIRLLFALFSVMLLAPVSFLVYRAVHSADFEARMQHRVIAERIFDEMERALSRLLEKEEERPVDGYVSRVHRETFPFVTWRFQMDPNGELEVVAIAEAAADQASALSDMEAAAGQVEKDLESTLAGYWRDAAAGKEKKPDALSQLPGTTVTLDERGRANVEEDEALVEDRSEVRPEEVSAFDAIRALNKGVQDRVDRLARDPVGERFAKLEPLGAAEPLETAGEDADSSARTRQRHVLRSLAEAESATSARLLDAQQLLLIRTIVREARVYRQGAVIDLDRLRRWLQQRSIGSEGAAIDATFDLSTPLRELDSFDGASAYVYRHRFAPPFDDVTLRLALVPLPGVGSSTYVYFLSLLLFATAALGLAAIYRMVSVVVSFGERRGNFVAAVTHELKTPLTAIRMYGEMLRDGIVPSEAKRDEYHRHITAESERLSRLIDNVLEFSRLEKGNRDIHLVSGPVGPVLRAVADSLGPHLESMGFRLRLQCDDAVPPVRFDRDALVQVLCNLVDNAAKYAGASEPREIELRCWQEDAGVCVAVRDHGPGVPRRQLGKIFEPFYRGENELTRRSKGTGLGLALVRSLCERMHAHVEARTIDTGGFEVEVKFST